MIDGGPLLPEILDQTDRVGAKSRIPGKTLPLQKLEWLSYLMLETARSYLHSSGQNTGTWRTDSPCYNVLQCQFQFFTWHVHVVSDWLRRSSTDRPKCTSTQVDRPWSCWSQCAGKCFLRVMRLHVFSERERERSLSSSVCLSVCRLSSVTFVHLATQAIEIFGNVSTPFSNLAICDPSVKILRRSSQGNPPLGG